MIGYAANKASDPDTTEVRSASGVAHLGHEIGATVVAEGIDTDAQLSAAIAAGCDAVQGFLLGRPMTADDLRRAVRQAAVPAGA